MSTNILADVREEHSQSVDDQLLAEAKAGDPQAFGQLCQRYSAMLRRRIFSIVRHREDTEDVLQDTFLSAYKHLHAFRDTCNFSTWLTKIGINTSLMLLRKRRKMSKTCANEFETLELRNPAPDPEQEYITEQTFFTLRKAIQKLPPRMRSAMDLYYREECRIKEAAAMLGITEAAAKSRVLRARRTLHRLLTQQNADAVNHKHARKISASSAELYVFANKNRLRAQNHLTSTVSDSVALVQSECPSPLTP